MIRVYIKSVSNFFELLKINELSKLEIYFKYVVYYSLVPLFILRIVNYSLSILLYYVITHGQLDESSCTYWAKNWFGG